MNTASRVERKARRMWSILLLAVKRFSRIDGAQWAGAFGFNAFFSLFPLLVLLVTIISFIVDRDRAAQELVVYVEKYVPMSGELHRQILDAVTGAINARGQAGMVALLILVWGSHRCFTTLICATNRAWGTEEYHWWRLPLKSMVLLAITAGVVLLGMAMPVLMRMTNHGLIPVSDVRSWLYAVGAFSVPLIVVFLSLSLFYRLAPRTQKPFSDVWAAALFSTVLLKSAESLFIIYIRNFTTLNAVYGALGGIMALLLWIYFSGCIFIFGACLCAARTEGHGALK